MMSSLTLLERRASPAAHGHVHVHVDVLLTEVLVYTIVIILLFLENFYPSFDYLNFHDIWAAFYFQS
jgi:hypothetical protein